MRPEEAPFEDLRLQVTVLAGSVQYADGTRQERNDCGILKTRKIRKGVKSAMCFPEDASSVRWSLMENGRRREPNLEGRAGRTPGPTPVYEGSWRGVDKRRSGRALWRNILASPAIPSWDLMQKGVRPRLPNP